MKHTTQPERSEPNVLKPFYPCNESFSGEKKQLKEILYLKVIAVESFEQQEFKLSLVQLCVNVLT